MQTIIPRTMFSEKETPTLSAMIEYVYTESRIIFQQMTSSYTSLDVPVSAKLIYIEKASQDAQFTCKHNYVRS